MHKQIHSTHSASTSLEGAKKEEEEEEVDIVTESLNDAGSEDLWRLIYRSIDA